MVTERKATIRRGAADVFAMLIDVDRLVEWRENLIKIERVSPPGPIHGARFRETMSTPFGPKTAIVQLETQAPVRFSFAVVDGSVRPRGTIGLREVSGTTEVTFRVTIPRLFVLPSVADAVAAAFVGASVDRSLARLKGILERDAP